MNRKPKYTYEPRGHQWAVLSWEYIKTVSIGSKIATYETKEEARSEVYRLNGWKLPVQEIKPWMVHDPVRVRIRDNGNNARILKLQSMENVRAKFKCVKVIDQPDSQQKLVDFEPVRDGSEENKSFAKYTPAAGAYLNISYETPASDFFEEGKEYYLDFTKTEN